MRKAFVVLCVAFIGSAAGLLWLWQELRAARAQNAELSARVHAATTLATAVPASVTTAPAAGSATFTATPAATQAVAAASTAHEDPWEENQRRLLKDPQYREAWKAQYRSNYAPRRENSIRLLGFSPAQADAMIELQIEQQLALVESPPVDDEDPESVQQRQDYVAAGEKRFTDQARALLGDAKYEKFRDYMESRPSRLQVDRFRNQLGEADALRDDQVEPLIAALHVEQAREQQELLEFSEDLDFENDPVEAQRRYGAKAAELMLAAHKRARAAASAILTGPQLRALDEMFKRQQEQQLTQQRMRNVEAEQARLAN